MQRPHLHWGPACGASSGGGTGSGAEGSGGTWSRRCHTPSPPPLPGWAGAAGRKQSPCCTYGRTLPTVMASPWHSPSPAAGRTGSPARVPASRDSGSAHAPSAGDDRSSRFSPPSSRSGVGRRVGHLLRTPSLQRRKDQGCPWAGKLPSCPGLSGPEM